jgi:hypothetical protein
VFPKLSCILEKHGVRGLGEGTTGQGALARVAIGMAKSCNLCLLGRRFIAFGQPALVPLEPALQDSNSGLKVVSDDPEEVDVVEVGLATEAMGEVVAWVDRGEHFAAAWAEEAEVALAPFGGRTVGTEGGDDDGHGQVVANSAQQFFGDHGFSDESGDVGSIIAEVGLLLPMGLHEDAVDVVDVDGSVSGADGFDEATDAEVAGLAQNAVGGTNDQVNGRLGEGVVSEPGPVEFANEEAAHVVGIEPFGDDGVGDAAFDVLVDAEVEIGEQAGMANEDEVVVLGEVLEEQTQLAEVVEVHEVGVVEDGGDRLAGVVEAEGLFDEPAFALEGGSFEFDAEGVAEDFDGIGVRVQRSGNGGDEMLVFGQPLEGLFDNAFAGPGQPEDEAEASLLAMDLERMSAAFLKGTTFALGPVPERADRIADRGSFISSRSIQRLLF